jgi:dipeptidase E
VAAGQRHHFQEITPNVHKRLLLHAGGDGTSARLSVIEHLHGARRAVMIPYAQSDHERATARFAEWLTPHGVEITGVHASDDPAEAIAEAEAIFVTGGNSFRLVNALHRFGLIEPVREAIARGVPYFGASAGANVACPTIRTTNDMPIVQPPNLTAFGLVPFQINPHYIDPPPPEARVGETREERLREFLEENHVTVIALREQSWLAIDGPAMRLVGTGGAVLFRRGQETQQLVGGADLSDLLLETPRYDA